MMTEEQALTKWCPHFRHPVYPMDDRPSGGNSMHAGETAPVCIGSVCMMWRWDSMPIDLSADVPVWGGYCGLAGRPDDRRGNGGKP